MVRDSSGFNCFISFNPSVKIAFKVKFSQNQSANAKCGEFFICVSDWLNLVPTQVKWRGPGHKVVIGVFKVAQDL